MKQAFKYIGCFILGMVTYAVINIAHQIITENHADIDDATTDEDSCIYSGETNDYLKGE